MVIKVLKALAATVCWSWLIAASIDSVVYTVLFFPWMLLLAWGWLLPMAAITYFWLSCWLLAARLDNKPRTKLEAFAVLPWVLLAAPAVVHALTLLAMIGSWYSAITHK